MRFTRLMLLFISIILIASFNQYSPPADYQSNAAEISQIDLENELIYSTFIDGGMNQDNQVVVDRFGNTYVLGSYYIRKSNQNNTLIFEKSMYARGITVDEDQTIHLWGCARESPTYPIIGYGARDEGNTFYTKLNKNGKIVFNTYLNIPCPSEFYVDESQNVYFSLVDPLYNNCCPLPNGQFRSIKLFKFNKLNKLILNTTITTDQFTDQSIDRSFNNILIDKEHVYVGARINSGNALFSLSKYKHSGELIYSTPFARVLENRSTTVSIFDISLDKDKNLYATGWIDRDDNLGNPSDKGSENTYIVKLDSAGNVILETEIVTSNPDQGIGIIADRRGFIYVTGTVRGSDFPVVGDKAVSSRGQYDIFFMKLDQNGEIIFSTLLGGSLVDTPISMYLARNDYVYIVGRSSSVDFPILGQGASNYEQVDGSPFIGADRSILVIFTNGDGTAQFEKEPTVFQSIILPIIGGISTVGILGIGYYVRIFRPRRLSSKILTNQMTNNILDLIFNGKTDKFLLFATGIHKKIEKQDIETHIPKDMFEYKFLMHPVRLAMMKILIENQTITSTKLKNKLGISWGELSHHLATMNKNNLVVIEDKFIEGITKQTIVVEPEGEAQYNRIVEMLLEFLSSSNYDRYDAMMSQLYPQYISDTTKGDNTYKED